MSLHEEMAAYCAVHTAKLEKMIKEAMALNGFELDVNISREELKTRGKIITTPTTSTLVIDDINICRWETQTVSQEGFEVIKIATEYRFQVL